MYFCYLQSFIFIHQPKQNNQSKKLKYNVYNFLFLYISICFHWFSIIFYFVFYYHIQVSRLFKIIQIFIFIIACKKKCPFFHSIFLWPKFHFKKQLIEFLVSIYSWFWDRKQNFKDKYYIFNSSNKALKAQQKFVTKYYSKKES